MAEPIDPQEIRYLGDVQRLELRPDDIIVLSVGMCLSNAAYANLKASVEQTIPGHKVMILDEGMQIGVLSPTAEVGPDAPPLDVRLDGSL